MPVWTVSSLPELASPAQAGASLTAVIVIEAAAVSVPSGPVAVNENVSLPL